MSRVDALIAEMCPDGVSYKALAEVTARGSNIRWADAGGEEYRYIDLTSVDRVTRRIGETATIMAGAAPSRAQQIVRTGDVIFATTRPTQMRWAVIPVEYDGQIASTGYCVLRPNKHEILTNFLAHLLGAERFRRYVEEKQVPGNYPSIPDNLVRAFRIPVPPVEVQREIVRVLDTFTELDAELEAELQARRRQFAHYRDDLLAFVGRDDVQWEPLKSLGSFLRGRRFTKADCADSGIPAIHYGEIYTRYGTSARAVFSYLRRDLPTVLRFAEPGDVVVVDVGETVEDVGKAVAWLGDEPVAIHDHTYAFRHSMNAAFVSYCMQTATFQAQRGKYVARTKVKTLLIDGFGRIAIPVPSLAEQERIVAILDEFDLLVRDVSVGLPAELAARRQQYAHYRDRLLTFEEAVS